MSSSDDELRADLLALRERLDRLERQVAGLPAGMGQRAGGSWVSGAGRVPPVPPGEAAQRFRDLLPALQALARERGEPQIYYARADARTASGGGPSGVSALADEQTVEPLARLGAAAGHPSRARLVRELLLGEECATTALAAATGLSGGNLYQHLGELHAANLIYQPRRGAYRLTAAGRIAAEMLFHAALGVRKPLPPDLHQDGWYPEPDPAGN